jgi:hypothetical protein
MLRLDEPRGGWVNVGDAAAVQLLKFGAFPADPPRANDLRGSPPRKAQQHRPLS